MYTKLGILHCSPRNSAKNSLSMGLRIRGEQPPLAPIFHLQQVPLNHDSRTGCLSRPCSTSNLGLYILDEPRNLALSPFSFSSSTNLQGAQGNRANILHGCVKVHFININFNTRNFKYF